MNFAEKHKSQTGIAIKQAFDLADLVTTNLDALQSVEQAGLKKATSPWLLERMVKPPNGYL